MGFQIVSDVPRTIWAPVDGSTKPYTEATPRIYVGQIVKCQYGGIHRITDADGVNDSVHRTRARGIIRIGAGTSANNTILGVVIGTNKTSPTFSSTMNTEYIDYVIPTSAGTNDYAMVEGPWNKGDRRAMVKVALIDEHTVLRSPLYSSSGNPGTAPSVLTVTTAAGSTGATTATCGFTPVAGFSTVCFRSGNNAGAYRVCTDTSATVSAWEDKTMSAVAVGDTLVKVAFPTFGVARARTNTLCTFFNAKGALSTSYWGIHVVKLDLSVAGQEYVEFKFDPCHFETMAQATS